MNGNDRSAHSLVREVRILVRADKAVRAPWRFMGRGKRTHKLLSVDATAAVVELSEFFGTAGGFPRHL
jgi:hypothetical protein